MSKFWVNYDNLFALNQLNSSFSQLSSSYAQLSASMAEMSSSYSRMSGSNPPPKRNTGNWTTDSNQAQLVP